MQKTVLEAGQADYSDMTEIGTVTISKDEFSGRIMVNVDGFTFGSAEHCRSHAVKAIAWARDVLAANVEAERLVPGGQIVSALGLDQDGVNALRNSRQPR